MHLLLGILVVIVIVKALQNNSPSCAHEHVHRCNCGKEF